MESIKIEYSKRPEIMNIYNKLIPDIQNIINIYLLPKETYNKVLDELLLRFTDEESDVFYYQCDNCGYNGFTMTSGEYYDYCYSCIDPKKIVGFNII